MKFFSRKYILTFLFLVVFICSLFAFVAPIHAGIDLAGTLNDAGTGIYGEGNAPGADTMPQIIGRVIRVVLSLVGVMLVIIIVYAGFLWMTAGGDAEQVKKAKAWLTNAVIGLIIALAAYTITAFVIERIGKAVTEVPAAADDSD